MKKEDWNEFDQLYAEYLEAQQAYHESQANLRGAFSELARAYDKASLDHNRLYEEELAHQRFNRARDRLNEFLNEKLKKD